MGVPPDITRFGKAGMQKKMSSVIDFMQRMFFSLTVVTYIETFGKAVRIRKWMMYSGRWKYQGVNPTLYHLLFAC